MALNLYKHNQYGTLSYFQVDSNWTDIEQEVSSLSTRLPLNNYAAITDPTVNDDVTQGYSNGSLWYNRTTDTAFVLTNASSGSANWVERDSISASDLGSAAFADILGTVSQSGGVPTGALMEYGSNANGHYLKLADGSMFCRAIVAASTGGAATWSFPASFASVSHLDANCQPLNAAARVGAIVINSVNSAAFSSWSLGGTRQDGDCSLSAQGRWFV